MIELLSYGDQLRPGRYSLHSRFGSAANFVSESGFAFVVIPGVGAGPLNIVVSDPPVSTLSELEIAPDMVMLNGRPASSGDSKLYDSEIRGFGIDWGRFIRNLPEVERALIRFAPPKSLLFLIDPERKTEFATPFDLAIAHRIEEGVRMLLGGDHHGGTQRIRGVGYGLTPSGDDFLSGFLIALNLREKVAGEGLSPVISVIKNAAMGGNRFTNAFLECASSGRVSEKFKRLIIAMGSSGNDSIESRTRDLLGVGSTSGADQAVGFLKGIKGL